VPLIKDKIFADRDNLISGNRHLSDIFLVQFVFPTVTHRQFQFSAIHQQLYPMNLWCQDVIKNMWLERSIGTSRRKYCDTFACCFLDNLPTWTRKVIISWSGIQAFLTQKYCVSIVRSFIKARSDNLRPVLIVDSMCSPLTLWIYLVCLLEHMPFIE
jgi:hypothetical protein